LPHFCFLQRRPVFYRDDIQNSAAIDTPVDSGTAYLGKWRLVKLDGVAFVARPLRSKTMGISLLQ